MTGQVQLAINSNTPSGTTQTAQATFGGSFLGGTSLATVGNCDLYQASGTSTFPTGSAGVVHTSSPAGSVDIIPSGTYPSVTYNSSGLPTPLFNAGDTISFSAPGGPDVPAFMGQVVAPPAITGWTPPTTISHSAGLGVTWMPNSGTQIGVLLFAADTSTGDVKALICIEKDIGMASIIPAQLDLLPASNTYGGMMLVRAQSQVVAAGAWSISLEADQVDQAGTIGTITIGP